MRRIEKKKPRHGKKNCYERNSLGFSRITSLSDGVFAIAMTILVLNIGRSDIAAEDLLGALAGQTPQFIAFILSFALVANLWWQHHQIVEMLGFFEPVMVAVNLVLLGAVVLVPFPTNLIGIAPDSRAAVLTFILLFILISLLYIVFLVRARAVNAWLKPLTLRHYFWLIGNWGSGILVMLIALVLSIWVPIGGLIIMGLSILLGPLASKRQYRRWA